MCVRVRVLDFYLLCWLWRGADQILEEPYRMTRRIAIFATLIVDLLRLAFYHSYISLPCAMSFYIRRTVPFSKNFISNGPQRYFSRPPFRLFPAGSADNKPFKNRSSKVDKVSSSDSATDLLTLRRAKIDTIREAGAEPFAYSFDRNCNAQELHNRFSSLPADGEDETADIRYAGRIMIRRFFGKLAFFEMQDESGRIQLYIDMTKLGADTSAEKKRLTEWTDAGKNSILSCFAHDANNWIIY